MALGPIIFISVSAKDLLLFHLDTHLYLEPLIMQVFVMCEPPTLKRLESIATLTLYMSLVLYLFSGFVDIVLVYLHKKIVYLVCSIVYYSISKDYDKITFVFRTDLSFQKLNSY